MKKVIVIGCPGSGKSVFSRALRDATGLPLYPLDMICWRADRTMIPKEERTERILEILKTEAWIVDGNYSATMELRMSYCDTIFFLDYPTEVCYQGILSRRGKPREDMPWIEPADGTDEEFVRSVLEYNETQRPKVLERIARFPDRELHIFRTRADADAYLRRFGAAKEEGRL